MGSLNEAVTAYQDALDGLFIEFGDDVQTPMMRVLVARDKLARLVSVGRASNPDMLRRIIELDQRLKDLARDIADRVGPATLASWRETVKPVAGAWWWHLDERAASAELKPSPLWAIAAGLFLTLSISLTVEIASRFLSARPDFYGTFTTAVQALATLLAGSALTDFGRQAIERYLSRRGIRRHIQPAVGTGLALTLLLLVLGLRLSLPLWARSYNNAGIRLQAAGRITSATEHFERAISLAPDYAVAHYNLATTYEDVLNYEQALSEYQRAIENDGTFFPAYNNLARVHLLHNDDPVSALGLLNIALEQMGGSADGQQAHVQYSLLKNRGWANLELKHYGLAETDLKQALVLRPDGAAAHCLLAQVREAQSDAQAGLAEWEACLRYARGDFVEPQWVALAQERLAKRGAQ